MTLMVLERPQAERAWSAKPHMHEATGSIRVGSITTIRDVGASLHAKQRTAADPDLATRFKMVTLAIGSFGSGIDLLGLAQSAVQVARLPEPSVRPVESDDRIVSMLAEAKQITGWSWDRLAQALGCTRQALHDWRQGKPLSAINAERLSRLHATLVFIDRGSAEETRALLESQAPDGGIMADLLKTGRLDEVRSLLGQGGGRRDVSRWTRLADEAAREEIARKGHWFDRLADSDGVEAVLEPPQAPVTRRVVVRRG